MGTILSFNEEKNNEKQTTMSATEHIEDAPPASTEGGDVNDADIDSNWFEVVESFDDMGLQESLLRGIYAYGFERPSAIQQRAIVPILTGRDVIAQAQSGTGKTATFTISILQSVDTAI